MYLIIILEEYFFLFDYLWYVIYTYLVYPVLNIVIIFCKVVCEITELVQMACVDSKKKIIALIKKTLLIVFIHHSPQNVFETTPFDFKNHNGPSTPAGYSILFQAGVVGTIFLLLLYYI